ncbi:DUF2911 domain-containing protein [Maribacter sp. 2210JD10-5]|uniref:DUF2911 domain-containing protein n=1 Tax=Maribacter sp. 2210JD10-5 TaxID=3386272 RepID=UPI0039BD7E69
MIQRILLLFSLIITTVISAQINKPSLSPKKTVNETVGLCEVVIEYGQPNKQGRQIFGGLIPYGKVWRTGANASTKLTFDRDVTLMDNKIPAGTYGLYSIPDEKEWTIIIHKNSEFWGSGGYEPNNDLLRFKVSVTPLKDTLETLAIGFENFTTNGGDMYIAWENTKIIMPLFVDSDAIIFKEISDKIINTSDPVEAQTYFDAAQFYYLKEKDLVQAAQWFEKAMELRPEAFWFTYYRAELAFRQKNYKVAKTNAEKSLKAAKASPSTDYGYIAKNELLLHLIKEQLR